MLPTPDPAHQFRTDFPELTIATDTVDPEQLQSPRRWDIGFIRPFMLTFGVLSSVFDLRHLRGIVADLWGFTRNLPYRLVRRVGALGPWWC